MVAFSSSLLLYVELLAGLLADSLATHGEAFVSDVAHLLGVELHILLVDGATARQQDALRQFAARRHGLNL